MKRNSPESIARKIAEQILDVGLANSTLRDLYPEAYKELLVYRKDIIADIEKILKENK